MTDHCAYPKCKKELTHTQGRRKKKYCDQNCNTRHWQMLHPKHKSITKRVSIEVLREMELAKLKLAEMMRNPMGILGGVGHRINIEDIEHVDLANKHTEENPNQKRISEINELLKAPPKYLPKEKRTRLENELRKLTTTQPQ